MLLFPVSIIVVSAAADKLFRFDASSAIPAPLSSRWAKLSYD
jgi:hypothetical protein